MARFEEVQMRLAESAKNFLELYNMQVFVEQFTLDRESKFSLVLPDTEPPFPVTATVSFIYDAFQTGMTLYEDSSLDKDEADIDTSIELDFTVHFPIMKGAPDMRAIIAEIEDAYPDMEPALIVKDIWSDEEPLKEHELSYNYSIEAEDILDQELLDELFEELRGVLTLVHDRTKDYIDKSWYREEDDPFKRN
ncbi:MAG: hypothetical protein ACLPX5_08070 [Dissulfurispiraceae bacterium]